MGLILFIAGAGLFFGAHLFTSFRKHGPGDIRERMGQKYRGFYALASVPGLALLIWGYALMRPGEAHLWDAPAWAHPLLLAAMFPVFVILAATYSPPGFVKKWTGHPMVTALILWAGLHILQNGDFAEVLLFGSFFVYGAIDRIALLARRDRGAAGVKPNILGDMIAIAAGGGVYLAFVFGLHRLITGAPIA